MQGYSPAGGRGRHMVLPAWMTQGQNAGAPSANGAAPAIPPLSAPSAGLSPSPRATTGFAPVPAAPANAVAAPPSGVSGSLVCASPFANSSEPNGAPKAFSGTPRWMQEGGRSRSGRSTSTDSRDGAERSRSRRERETDKRRRSSASSRASSDAHRVSRKGRSRSSSAESRRHRRGRDTSGREDSRRSKRRRSRSNASRSGERRRTDASPHRREERRDRRKTSSSRRHERSPSRGDRSHSEDRRRGDRRRSRRNSSPSDYPGADDSRASAATLADRILEVRQMPQAKRGNRRSDLLTLLAKDDDFYAEDRYGKGFGRTSYVSDLSAPPLAIAIRSRHSFSVDFEEHTDGRDQIVLYECVNGKMVRVYCFRDSENLVRRKLSLDELQKTRIYEKARKYCSRKGVPADAKHHYFDYVNNPEIVG
ncbi:conserved hypothetical protein [Neospora caninum Liverpool]|uniref:Uncharacterized protein n=1 Tax=Neospora caninum (strain Liverpool) TaxID=572307 RepID=F0VN82_NEOCL|nr:conserved hypothetical protein [Neospora caninum Liverpool]CBZ55178.1 conserved hypothetical protein [Neospora caninum Liverpool]|eukprot:XP_003885206.1 conserved hypothetical protein [Neospora caninum Liverpool]